MDDKKTLELTIKEMAGRIRELREITGLSVAEMAERTGTTAEEYTACEKGLSDLNFAFIYRCALAFGVDVTDIISGSSPTLKSYTVTRKGEGQRIEQAHGMVYYNLASAFKNRIAEPLLVRAAYSKDAELLPIEVTTHEGQECDIIIKGKLKVRVGSHIETLSEGDTIYYDSSTPHGMIAVDGQDCIFYAIVLNPEGEQKGANPKDYLHANLTSAKDMQERIYERFVESTEDENGLCTAVKFKDPEHFNFAFDVLDALGTQKPDKLAMVHVSADKTERRFTFAQMKRVSSQCANYFKSLGIKRGDRVMLILKRHYQFWFAMMGLNKLGAVAIPASNQLLSHDLEYRFNAAGVSAIICTSDGSCADEVEVAIAKSPCVKTKIIVGAKREGWRDFDSEYNLFSGKFGYEDKDERPQGDDLMLMYFTSGTTGYPKIAAHSYKYPLGHFITAKYWHCVDPEGLHLTISDTGWAKAMWGKLYGQWLCEGAIFVYDFDRFDASDILPLFAKYNITTFCAPPTMYRMLIKEDLAKYDLSSIKHASIAGEALNPEVFRQFESATGGIKIMEGFGQSESTLIIGNLAGMPYKIGSMGRPVPIYKVELVDTEGRPVAPGESGEIVIRAEKNEVCGLFCGYYNDEEKTNEAWHDGLYHTGDIAWCDEDGFYWYIGRADDVIKSSGYRIGPFEIESVLMELPYILECGVSAEPDEIRGQIVKASIVLTKGTVPSEELKKEIQEYVKHHTAPYKYPRIIVFRDSLPKTVSGKIQRNKL